MTKQKLMWLCYIPILALYVIFHTIDREIAQAFVNGMIIYIAVTSVFRD